MVVLACYKIQETLFYAGSNPITLATWANIKNSNVKHKNIINK